MTDDIEHSVAVMEDFYRDWRRTRAWYLTSLGFVAVGAMIVMTLLILPAFAYPLSTLLWVPAGVVMLLMATIYTFHYRAESTKKKEVVEELTPYVMARIDSLEDSAVKRVFKARIRRMG